MPRVAAVAILLFSVVACGSSQPNIVRIEQPAAATAPAADSADAPEAGFVTFHLATPGAVVTLVCDCRPEARKSIPQFPLRVKFPSNQHWQVRATKPGFSDYIEDIRFERGVTEKSITIRLVPSIQAEALPMAAESIPVAHR